MTNANKNNKGLKNSNMSKKLSSVVNRGKGLITNKGNVVKVLIGLFVLLIVGMIAYWVYNAVVKSSKIDKENPIIIAGDVHTQNLNKDNKDIEVTLPSTANSDSPSLSYTISFWVYVEKWETNNEKIIMCKPPTGGPTDKTDHSSDQFCISLAENVNTLIVRTRVNKNVDNNIQQE